MRDNETAGMETTPPRGSSRSLLWPLTLISVGLALVLDNLGVLPSLDWVAVWRYWPLALIFGGLDLLVTQLRRPVGTLLSLLVTLAALAALFFVLLGNRF